MHIFKKYSSSASFSIFCFTLTVLIFSCHREKGNWDDNLVAPIAEGQLGLSSLFPDTTIKTNTDSSLSLVFNSQLINYQLNDLLKIPDTAVVTKALDTVIAFFAFQPGATLFKSTDLATPTENQFNLPNGILLRYGTIHQGKINIKLYNTVRQPLVYHFQLISATRNNHILDTTINIPAAIYLPNRVLASKGFASASIDLTGYSIDLTGSAHNEFNTIVQSYTVSVANNASADTLFLNQGLIDSLFFKGVIPQYAQGYFGSQLVKIGPDTTLFNVFNQIRSGILNLNSATIGMNIVNQFGIEMQTNIQNLSSINSRNPSMVVLNATPFNAPIHINAATNNGPLLPVTVTTKSFTLNNGNSNITSFIGNLPDKIAYTLQAQVNPNGMQNGYNDFGYYGTSFSAWLNANIPMNFGASNLVLGDTMAINMSGENYFLKNINRGELILTATNGYPFSIQLQGHLLDVNKVETDQLFSLPNLIQCPPLDANHKVVIPLQTKLFIPLNPSKITHLASARYIYYTATFNTPTTPARVIFYNNYTLKLLLTADINYSVVK